MDVLFYQLEIINMNFRSVLNQCVYQYRYICWKLFIVEIRFIYQNIFTFVNIYGLTRKSGLYHKGGGKKMLAL